ncbi:PREDICTED: brain mitochondrial carrier [Prunus dulcis]|uniref:PREDICTED: brain mitochondrial carrier n=1 Tax=Prunus dulcis TaxID=3755 RepID=A0A5E4FR19_PRUDU|nr:PREDICTED: brain mitochondrial carrier [Prunus dulcis]
MRLWNHLEMSISKSRKIQFWVEDVVGSYLLCSYDHPGGRYPWALVRGCSNCYAQWDKSGCHVYSQKMPFDVLLWKRHEGDGRVLLPWQSMISGFLAGTAGPVCTGPFDVVKTRLMAQSRGVDGQMKYKGMIHAIRTIYPEEGLLALWKGLLPLLMRIPLGQAIVWTVAGQVIGLYEGFSDYEVEIRAARLVEGPRKPFNHKNRRLCL